MYVIGFIIACIVMVVVLIIKTYIAYRNSKVQFTEWEYDSEYPPLISTVDGEQMFQNIKCYGRYNRFEEKWEFKKVVDPVKRPLNEAKSLSDKYWLMYR